MSKQAIAVLIKKIHFNSLGGELISEGLIVGCILLLLLQSTLSKKDTFGTGTSCLS